MKIVGAIFDKMVFLIFFLMWTTLNFKGRSNTEKLAGDIFKGALDVECEGDWSIGLGTLLGIGQKIKSIFLLSGIFPGSRYCHIVGLRMY